MPLYQYKCDYCGVEFEAFASIDDRDEPQPCRECTGNARHIITPTHFKLEGVTGDFPTAADQWVKKRKEKMAQEAKAEE